MEGRKFVVGDIRGEIGLMKKLLDKIQPTHQDTVLFLGSYIGPGKDSKATIECLLQLRQQMPGTFYFLRGCYEYVFGLYLSLGKKDRNIRRLWDSMGGRTVLSHYVPNGKPIRILGDHGSVQTLDLPFVIPEQHLKFMENDLHLWYEDTVLPFVACHSGAHPVIFGKQMNNDAAVFGVNRWWEGDLRLPGKEIVFSHVPFREPFQRPGAIGIDLGAGLGGGLCSVEMFSKEFTIVR